VSRPCSCCNVSQQPTSLTHMRDAAYYALHPRRARVLRQPPPLLRVFDQRGESLLPGLFPLRAHHPPDGEPTIRGRLRLEEIPRLGIGAKLPLVRVIERTGVPFIGVLPLLLSVASLKSGEAGRLHQPLCREFTGAGDIDGTPDA